jgi:hypothetical protein
MVLCTDSHSGQFELVSCNRPRTIRPNTNWCCKSFGNEWMKHDSSGVGVLARTIQVDGSNGRPWISFLFVFRPHLSVMTTQSPFFPDERLQGPQSISLIRADQTKPSPKSGAVQLEWNKTGSLLLVRFGEHEGILFSALVLNCLCLQKMYQQWFTYTLSLHLRTPLCQNYVPSLFTPGQFCTHSGIPSAREVSRYAVGLVACTRGVMNG